MFLLKKDFCITSACLEVFRYKFVEKIYCFNWSEIAIVDHAIHNGTETGHRYYITEYNYFEQFTNFIFTYSRQLFSAKLV